MSNFQSINKFTEKLCIIITNQVIITITTIISISVLDNAQNMQLRVMSKAFLQLY